MEMVQEDITPAKAEEYLGTKASNRNIRERYVERLAQTMKNGEWDSNNPDPIGFNEQGKLVNGQHRLSAIARGKRPVKLWVARAMKDNTIITMDTGKSRTMADLLRMKGESSAPELAAILRQIELYRKTGQIGTARTEVTHKEMLRLLEKEPTIREAVHVAAKLKRLGYMGMGPGLWGTLWYVFAEIDEDDADAFMEQLIAGEDLKAGDPLFALRKVIVENAGRNNRKPPKVLAALIIKTWNAWRQGEEVQLLSWRGGGKNPEPFPIVE